MRPFALALLLAAAPALAQVQPQSQPGGLTPLGPVQAPRPSAPPNATPSTVDPPIAIERQSLPSLTPPDPAFATPAAPQPPAAQTAPTQPAPATPPPARAPATPATPPPTPATPAPAVPGAPLRTDWQPRPTAVLRVVDKTTGRATTLTIKAGETATHGPLAIAVRSCVVRPPDQPADAMAMLDITDRGKPLFKGWMSAAYPSLALIEHRQFDVRVAACR